MDEKVTIRTSTGQLFGSFDSREEAWAAVGRIRETNHWESVEGAAVVPLLAGVTPMPVHPRFLSDEYEAPVTPQSLDTKTVHAAVDSLVGAYNDSRSLHLGYRYVSPSLLTSDRHLEDAVWVLLAPLHREVERLVGTLERRTAQRDAARADADAARARIAELGQLL